MADPDWNEARLGPRIDEAFAARRGAPAPLQALLHGIIRSLQLDLADAALPLLAAGATALPQEAWPHLLHDATRWCADPAALERLLEAGDALPGLWEGWRGAIRAARCRLAFGRGLAARGLDRIPVLSLGQDCLTFDLPQRFGFGIRAGGRLLLTSFSLAGHRPEVVLRVLEEEWEGYAPEEALLLLPSAGGQPLIARRDGRVIWNHHLGEHWAADRFARFRASLAGLQARFDTALDGASAPEAVFVTSSAHAFAPERDPALLARMLRALDTRPGWPRPYPLALHTPREPGPLAGAPEGRQLDTRIAAFELPIPRPDYVWWDDLHAATPEGLAFETRLLLAAGAARRLPGRAPGPRGVTTFRVEAAAAEAAALVLAGPHGRQAWSQTQLWSAVGAYAALIEDRTRPGEVVLIVSRTRLAAMAMFLAAIVAGRLPAFFPPRHPRQEAGYFAQQQAAAIGRIAPGLTVVTEPATRDGLLATSPELAPRLLLAPAATTSGAWQPAREALLARMAERRDAGLPLFLQHSSGTTGLKKACAVGAGALGAQYDCYWRQVICRRIAPEPRVASWLPLYHDMGLIAAFLLPLLDGAPVACLDAFDWVARPQLLPDLVEAERATLCWMPNFAFRHLVRLRRFLEARDLSSVGAWINASETCRGQDAQDFEAAYAGWGVRPGAVLGSYAMAETVFAVTQSLPGHRLSLAAPQALRPGERLAKDRLTDGPVTEETWPGARLIQSSGPPVPGTHLAAYHAGRRLPEGCYGELGLRSRCFVGHHGDGPARPGLLPDGTFLTGDLGVVMAGEAFVFGRVKEQIIVAGRNLHAGDIEAVAGEVPGVKPGRVVAFGMDNPATGTEDLVIVAERDPEAEIAPDAVRAALAECVAARFLAVPREVLVVEHRWLVKSTAGKISREANRRKYQASAVPAERGAT